MNKYARAIIYFSWGNAVGGGAACFWLANKETALYWAMGAFLSMLIYLIGQQTLFLFQRMWRSYRKNKKKVEDRNVLRF